MLQADSTSVQAIPEQSQPQHSGPKTLHPYQVLRWLPYNATPNQQDSAIQANIKPKEINFSTEPDTLHLPGAKPGKSITEVELPQYYKESFFAKDSLFHPELKGGRMGIAGDPVPYTVRGDNVITSVLLICFIFGLFAYAHTKNFLINQAKNFFYHPNFEQEDLSETAGEARFQIFLVFLTCLMIGMLYFFYNDNYMHETITLSSPYQVLAIYVGCVIAYYILKIALYGIVNYAFFDSKKNRQWFNSYFFIAALEGVIIFPIVLLRVYFNLSIENTVTLSIIVLIIAKILLFYKCYAIFFRKISYFLQIILYFCALELMPLFALWGILVSTDNYLKINY